MEIDKLYVLELFKLRTEVVCAALKSSSDLGYSAKYEFEKLMKDMREAWCFETNEGDTDGD